jgi:hypothetical protein
MRRRLGSGVGLVARFIGRPGLIVVLTSIQLDDGAEGKFLGLFAGSRSPTSNATQGAAR